MNNKVPQPVHESYTKHRRELTTQIILPVALTGIFVLVVVGLIINATFVEGTGDVARWAAVSTIWIAIPVIIGMLIFLVLLVGLIYLMRKLLGVTPTYTGKAQDYVHKAAIQIKRGADMTVKPIIAFESFFARVNAFLGRK